MYKLEQIGIWVYTATGRQVALIHNNVVYVNSYEFGRLIKPLRKLLGTDVHFIIM